MDLSARLRRLSPAIALMVLSPLVAEVLPGATRFHALFVFPIEVCVWGGGALLIREAVRKRKMGWPSLVLLAVALSLAEEFLIQQTSLAPMVIKIQRQEYARAFGVNYLYLLWAVMYEVVFVVLVPIKLTELIFWNRRNDQWLSRTGVAIVALLFLIGACLAWFTWTQIARTEVFHVPPYTPPMAAIMSAAGLIAVLIICAAGPLRNAGKRAYTNSPSPAPWALTTLGAVWAALWFCLAVLAFGIRPSIPPWIPVAAGLLLAGTVLVVMPVWVMSPAWTARHDFALISGAIVGSMFITFIAFIGSDPIDLYFKLFVDFVAFCLLLMFARRSRELELT
jgi:hypothetical protein